MKMEFQLTKEEIGLIEQQILKITIIVTFSLAVIRILFGLFAGSLSIVFDGMFDLFDTMTSILSFLVVRLLSKQSTRRFQYGFWHIEPIVLAFNGSVLIILCIYAWVSAIGSLISGGRELNIDSAVYFTAIMSVASISMYLFIQKSNHKIKSEFLRLDIQSWLISASISTALLIAFIIAAFMEGGPYAEYIRYIDPLILVLITSCLIFVPMGTVRDAMRDMLLIAPIELDHKIRFVLDELIKKYGFNTYSSYIAKIGRAEFIEIHILAPASYPIKSVESLDKIRSEIIQALGGEEATRWLTISFTSNHDFI